jgi:hypothetical protein
MSDESSAPVAESAAPEFQSLESIQAGEAEPTVTEPAAPQGKSSTFEIGDKQYSITEEQIRKYYGIPATEEFTDTTWKTIISNYKANIQANNKNQIASETKRQAEEAFRRLYDNPKDTLKLLFKQDPSRLKATLEEMLLEDIEDEMLDPRDREIKRYKQAELEREENEKQKIVADQEIQMRQLEDHYTQTIQTEIIDALQTSGLPKTSGTVRRAAVYLMQAAAKGLDLKVKDVLPLVREDYELEIKELFGGADPDMLSKFLGEGKMKELRNSDIKRLKSNIVDKRELPSEGGAPPPRETKKQLTPDEFRAIARRKIAQLR